MPYPHGSEDRKDIHMLSADEYKWRVEYPENLEALIKILNEHSEFIVIWKLPIDEDTFPDDGISMVILTTYRNTNLAGPSSLVVDTYIAYDCSMYVMNENGKTIDRVG
jgi:hypothetical protein